MKVKLPIFLCQLKTFLVVVANHVEADTNLLFFFFPLSFVVLSDWSNINRVDTFQVWSFFLHDIYLLSTIQLAFKFIELQRAWTMYCLTISYHKLEDPYSNLEILQIIISISAGVWCLSSGCRKSNMCAWGSLSFDSQ